jgi:O-antigen/teichoic acid export membrane protein
MSDAVRPLFDPGQLTATRVVITGALWNFLGRILPLAVAVAATPRLIALLGVDRWGIFALALSLVGIFGVFDFGVGRALTRGVAERLGAGDLGAAANLAWTGIILLAGLGLIGGGALATAVGWVTHDMLTLQPALQSQIERALYLLCLVVPLAVVNAGLWGVLAAAQRFRAANLVNVPVMACYYVGPLAVLPIWDDLSAVILVLVAARMAMTIAYVTLCAQAMPNFYRARFDPHAIPALLRLGGWMTVSNLIYPVLLYLDRFVVAAVLSVAATAFYATPYDLLTRAWIIPVAIMNPVFPALATAFDTQPATAARLYRRANLATLLLLLGPCLLVTLYGPWGLRLWLGAEFATQAGGVVRWLAVGLAFSCVSFVPSGLLDSVGRPDVNAKWSCLQVVIYIPLLLAAIRLFGIEGAAMAWSMRVALDCLTRLSLAAYCYKPVRPSLASLLMIMGLAAVILVTARLL